MQGLVGRVSLLAVCLLVVAVEFSSMHTVRDHNKDEFGGEGVTNSVLGTQNIGSGDLNFNITDLPECDETSLLTFTGTELICRPLPNRTCICPEPPTIPVPACPVFEPPEGGAYVCLEQADLIYCSVYCDNTHEFSTTPFNPYFCGNQTDLMWRDFTGVTYTALPDCTGFRHTARPFHRAEFYIAGPCDVVTQDPADVQRIMVTFCNVLHESVRRNQFECERGNVTVQCPATGSGSGAPPLFFVNLSPSSPNLNP